MVVNHVVVVGGVNVVSIIMENKNSEYKLKGSFICHKCRFICDGGSYSEIQKQLSGEIKPTDDNYDPDLYPRKQIITCLGPYCDDPCQFQKLETDLTLEQAITLIKWMGNKLNKLLIKE